MILPAPILMMVANLSRGLLLDFLVRSFFPAFRFFLIHVRLDWESIPVYVIMRNGENTLRHLCRKAPAKMGQTCVHKTYLTLTPASERCQQRIALTYIRILRPTNVRWSLLLKNAMFIHNSAVQYQLTCWNLFEQIISTAKKQAVTVWAFYLFARVFVPFPLESLVTQVLV